MAFLAFVSVQLAARLAPCLIFAMLCPMHSLVALGAEFTGQVRVARETVILTRATVYAVHTMHRAIEHSTRESPFVGTL